MTEHNESVLTKLSEHNNSQDKQDELGVRQLICINLSRHLDCEEYEDKFKCQVNS